MKLRNWYLLLLFHIAIVVFGTWYIIDFGFPKMAALYAATMIVMTHWKVWPILRRLWGLDKNDD